MTTRLPPAFTVCEKSPDRSSDVGSVSCALRVLFCWSPSVVNQKKVLSFTIGPPSEPPQL